jgi:hypothetical protein
MIALRIIAWAVSIAAVLAAYRHVRRRSMLHSQIMAFGIIVRAAAGVTLFTISMFDLPVLTSLQTGGGFWKLAIDAHYYFEVAARATFAGVNTVSWTEPSPGFIRVLTVWMQAIGLSPASGILFNLLCYVALTSIIAVAGAPRRVATVSIAAVTLSPALFIFSTQPLKDPFCLLLIAVIFGSLRLWCDGLARTEQRWFTSVTVGLIGAALAVYLVGGVRPYVGAMVLIAATAMCASVVVSGEPTARLRNAAWSAALMIALTAAFVYGTGVYFSYYTSFARRFVESPTTAPVAELDKARSGFVGTGGATSVGEAPRRSPAAPTEAVAGYDLTATFGEGLMMRLSRLGRGCLIMFVPISLLRATGVVNFSGGRGLLFLTDIDTLVNDLVLGVCIYFLVARYRPARWPLFVAVLTFTLLMTLALAYVVTNFGTLFRLRLMASAPVWLLPVLVRLRPRTAGAVAAVEQT